MIEDEYMFTSEEIDAGNKLFKYREKEESIYFYTIDENLNVQLKMVKLTNEEKLKVEPLNKDSDG